MSTFLAYVFLGLSLAAPIGPVNAAILDSGIKKGFIHAWLVGLGATVADGIYMMLVFYGLYQFIQISYIQSFLLLFGFFVLVYTGIESLASRHQLTMEEPKMNRDASYKSFFSGFFISLFNPITILFWLGIFGSILAKTLTAYGKDDVILYVTAIFIGIFIWDITMASLSSTLRRFLTNRLLTGISVVSGMTLIGFGIYFAIQAARTLFT